MKMIIVLLLVGTMGWTWSASTFGQSAETELVSETGTINFPGGTLSQYIHLVRAQVPTVNIDGEVLPTNIFITEDARNIRVPSVEMTTTIEGALGILSTISNDRHEILVDQVNDVTTISVASSILSRVEVINGKQLLEKITKEELLSAIEIGIQMQGNSDDIELKLHEQTGLLFVKGTHENNQLVSQIVAELNKANGIAFTGGVGLSGSGGGGGGGGGFGGGSQQGGGVFSVLDRAEGLTVSDFDDNYRVQ